MINLIITTLVFFFKINLDNENNIIEWLSNFFGCGNMGGERKEKIFL